MLKTFFVTLFSVFFALNAYAGSKDKPELDEDLIIDLCYLVDAAATEDFFGLLRAAELKLEDRYLDIDCTTDDFYSVPTLLHVAIQSYGKSLYGPGASILRHLLKAKKANPDIDTASFFNMKIPHLRKKLTVLEFLRHERDYVRNDFTAETYFHKEIKEIENLLKELGAKGETDAYSFYYTNEINNLVRFTPPLSWQTQKTRWHLKEERIDEDLGNFVVSNHFINNDHLKVWRSAHNSNPNRKWVETPKEIYKHWVNEYAPINPRDFKDLQTFEVMGTTGYFIELHAKRLGGHKNARNRKQAIVLLGIIPLKDETIFSRIFFYPDDFNVAKSDSMVEFLKSAHIVPLDSDTREQQRMSFLFPNSWRTNEWKWHKLPWVGGVKAELVGQKGDIKVQVLRNAYVETVEDEYKKWAVDIGQHAPPALSSLNTHQLLGKTLPIIDLQGKEQRKVGFIVKLDAELVFISMEGPINEFSETLISEFLLFSEIMTFDFF